MTHGLGLVGHHDACDSPSTENQRFMIACEIHHDTSLRKGTEGGAERRGVGPWHSRQMASTSSQVQMIKHSVCGMPWREPDPVEDRHSDIRCTIRISG